MVLDEDEEAKNVTTHHELLQNRMSIQNNVVTQRREQLRGWEKSEMNKLPAVRKPPSTSRVKFQEADIFFSACVSGDEDEVEDLLDKGADVNACTIDGVTALHQAVIDGKFEMVRFLVTKGADINEQDNEGWTPLHAAVCCGNISIIRYLCEKGADITVANSDKELPVDLAEDEKIRAYLEEQLQLRGLSPGECREREERVMMRDCMEWIRGGNYLDRPHPKTGATALHVAASKGYNKLISLLVQAGADVHAKDFEGWTPLHAAAHWAEKDACRILMGRGADINEQTLTGQDVLQVADNTIVEYLEQLNASKAKEEELSVATVSASSNGSSSTTPSSNGSNTSSSISSIETSSRSITSKDSSSSLYSSDQNVTFTFRPPRTPAAVSTVTSTTTSTNGTATMTTPSSPTTITLPSKSITLRMAPKVSSAAVERTRPSNVETPIRLPSSSVRAASPVSESVSLESSITQRKFEKPKTPTTTTNGSLQASTTSSSLTTPTAPQKVIRRINATLTAPTIASATRQRPPMLRGTLPTTSPAPPSSIPPPVPTNPPPWVQQWKAPNGSIIVGRQKSAVDPTPQQRAPSAESSTSSNSTNDPSAASTPSTSPAPGLRPSFAHLVQPSNAYRKSSLTPPQQPAPQKESEAERKAKSRLQRASRRSTQGVTIEQMTEARNTIRQADGAEPRTPSVPSSSEPQTPTQSETPTPSAPPRSINPKPLDDAERRTYERRIKELEYELQKVKQLQSDHKRLQDENNALIRVISKLSKDYPRTTSGNSLSVSSTTGSSVQPTAVNMTK